MTVREFWDLPDRCAICCRTEEQAQKLLRAFASIGKVWSTGQSYLGEGPYRYGSETSYTNRGTTASRDFYISLGETVFDFEEIDFPTMTLEEFFSYPDPSRICIHAPTEEGALLLLMEFDRLGRRWSSGNSYLDLDMWDGWGEETVYYANGRYGRLGAAKNEGVIILTLADVGLAEPEPVVTIEWDTIFV